MHGSINTMSQGLLLPGWPGASVDNGAPGTQAASLHGCPGRGDKGELVTPQAGASQGWKMHGLWGTSENTGLGVLSSSPTTDTFTQDPTEAPLPLQGDKGYSVFYFLARISNRKPLHS